MKLRLRSYPLLALLALGATPLLAQDLQPGRNFPVASITFGTGRSENVDPGDVDNDGDLDVLIANGGDGGKQMNRIYVNNGGLQGGTIGTFTDETQARFADNGILPERSRDCEFVDLESDGDLDIYISNRGGSIVGTVSRFYDNLGGVQGGTIGFFSESSDDHWGQLESIALDNQILGGNQGSWRDWSCDCDFADLDLDGDIDLFHSSYGPNIAGNQPSRVFLNDGQGVFDELFPWSDGDIQLHTLDIDLADFDGDFDIDVVASSRDSQARFYTNNLVNPVGPTPFSDTTSSTILAGGLFQSGANNYEAEYADLDADGDFDVWFKNLNGNEDKIGRNDTTVPGQTEFTIFDNLVNDLIVDENEVDFLDYDGDGDLDAFAANFSGTNWLYRSTLAQTSAATYQFRRTDASGEPAELPASGNTGQTLDGEAADVDGDGDEDLLIANDSDQPNRLFINALGIPDVHAPTFEQLEQVLDKPTGDDARVIAQVRDNSTYYLVSFYDTELVYSIDGAPEVRVDMFSQGGQQFMAFIPGDQNGCIEYRVESTDLAGNTGVSPTLSFVQGVCGGSWEDLGSALAGSAGEPSLAGTGTLVPAASAQIDLDSALPGASATLILGLAQLGAPFKGGTLVPTTDLLVPFTVGGGGSLSIPFTWPTTVPAGTQLYWQFWIVDPAGPKGLAASNALRSTAF